MNKEQLRKKRTQKALKRKREIERRIKDHGNKEKIVPKKKKVVPEKVIRKLKWYQRFCNWVKSLL